MAYTSSKLKNFAEKEPLESVIFYGGEPLIRMDKIREIMDTVPAEKFMIQTNGLLLDELEPRYLRRLHTILVSVDGDESLTDSYRGRGVYRRVIKNTHLIRKRGFKGELIARMTVGKQTRIDEQVWRLLFSKECVFDSVHWQLDAQFWHNDYDPVEFYRWTLSDYEPHLRNLIDGWIGYMEEQNKVLKIYPLLSVAETLLTGQPTKLRCGAGWAQFNVQTDGTVVPCPAMSGMKDYYLGNLKDTSPIDVSRREITVGLPCTSCELLWICGGRCLYSNITKLWGEEGFKLVCNTVEALVGGIKAVLPRIQRLIDEGQISITDLEYTRFNSCEIIP
jgi:putative peptide-modifying radical SAM enzyme